MAPCGSYEFHSNKDAALRSGESQNAEMIKMKAAFHTIPRVQGRIPRLVQPLVPGSIGRINGQL